MIGRVAAACLLLAAAPLAAQAGEETLHLKEAPGRDLAQARCGICHSLDYIPANAPVMDRAGWAKSIQKMRDRFGASVNEAEAQQILDYLAANYADKN